MAADTKILREYLLLLGFKIDEAGHNKFDLTVGKSTGKVGGMATQALQAARAINNMVTQFARSMERMYYASIKADSTASNLAAITYGAKQIGISSEAMQGAIEKVAMSLRMNPGMIAFAESFGVAVKGRDVSDVAKDLVKAWSKLPFYQGASIAQMFGISPEEYLLWSKQTEKLDQLAAAQKAMATEVGLDMEKAKNEGLEYANMLDRIAERFSLLKMITMRELLPTFKDLAGITERVLVGVSKLADLWGKAATVKEHAGQTWWDHLKFLMSGQAARDAMDLVQGKGGAGRRAEGTVGSEPLPSPGSSQPGGAPAFLGTLEKQFGLPSGFLDRMWAAESGRGKNKLGPMTKSGRAKGDFQFTDGTAKQYGVDVNSFESSAMGAARYMADLLKMFGGDIVKATAAYNWGPENVLKQGIGKAPLETRNYVDKVLPGTVLPITLNTTINLHGVTDAKTTGAVVAKAVNDTNSAILRNLATKVQ